jgi:hypothetical protein
MVTLTDQDREAIQNQIVEYRKSEAALSVPTTISLPAAPTGEHADEALNDALAAEAVPDKREARRVRRHIKGIWRKWRTTTLDAKSLEVERVACQIEIERAKAQAELNEIKRAEELARVKHWLTLNEGNLKDIGYNTESKPSRFWYGLKRASFHITKLTTDVPKIVLNLFIVLGCVIGLILLKRFNIL